MLRSLARPTRLAAAPLVRAARSIAPARAISTSSTAITRAVARPACPPGHAFPLCSASIHAPRLGLGIPARMRLMSSSSGPQENAAAAFSLAHQGLSWMRQNRTTVAVVLGMSVVMYGFYRAAIRTMRFFLHVPPQQIFTAGFIGGILAGLGVAAAVFFARRRLTFHADDIYGAALQELRKYPKVEEALGGAWSPGGFRGYSIESIQEAALGSDRRARSSYFEAPSRRVQMIFMVRGLDRDGMVSLEAFKRGGDYQFDMLSLDLKAKPESGLPAERARPGLESSSPG